MGVRVSAGRGVLFALPRLLSLGDGEQEAEGHLSFQGSQTCRHRCPITTQVLDLLLEAQRLKVTFQSLPDCSSSRTKISDNV